jgi:large subunit ribosomal protein L7/L12
MAISKEDILEAVGAMSVMDLTTWSRLLKRSSAYPQPPWPWPRRALAVPPQRLRKRPNSTSILAWPSGENKINVIKEVRAITGLGLGEAKDARRWRLRRQSRKPLCQG